MCVLSYLVRPFQHSLKLQDVFANSEGLLTNVTQKFSGCLDYIWASRQEGTQAFLSLRHVSSQNVQSLLLPLLPTLGQCKAPTEWLPNAHWPSDHSLLLARFQLGS